MPRNPTSLITFLRGVAIFGGLEGRRLERVMDMLEEQSFRPGEIIFNEGELGRTMYVLREGEVEVLRTSVEGKRVPIVRLGPGEVFGEMTLVELQPRSATIRVFKKALTYSLTNLDLYNLYREDNYSYVIVLQNICRLLSRRLRKADSRICEFISSGAGEAPPKPRRAAGGRR
ncbi:MAG: cyclic nucleotide-binding domain-containing protein [Myxococcales bacterium]|nr:cyclic nucleotide-binding domain-containing protein [Myxococcales bacterium]